MNYCILLFILAGASTFAQTDSLLIYQAQADSVYKHIRSHLFTVEEKQKHRKCEQAKIDSIRNWKSSDKQYQNIMNELSEASRSQQPRKKIMAIRGRQYALMETYQSRWENLSLGKNCIDFEQKINQRLDLKLNENPIWLKLKKKLNSDGFDKASSPL